MAKKYKDVYYDEKTKTYYIMPRIKNIDGSIKRPTIRGFNGPKEAYDKLQEYLFDKRKNPDTIDITLHDAKLKYINSLIGKLDEDTINLKETKLNHFCEIDKTNQLKTYPNKKIKSFDKELYIKWQLEMRNKKYKFGKNQKLFSIKHLNDIHDEVCRMIDYLIIEGYCHLNFARQAGKIGSPKEIKLSQQNKLFNVIDYDEFLALLSASKDNLKYNRSLEGLDQAK